MCSVLPSAGSSLTLLVSFVEAHAEGPLVRLWGLPGERREEYLRLTEDLQAKAGPRLASAPGGDGDGGSALGPGDLCLVELGGRWQRCRVVSRPREPGRGYRVFLLDEGRTVVADARYLARGPGELFQLPSEVLGCLVADLVPPGRSGRAAAAAAAESEGVPLLGPAAARSFGWSAGALEFLGCLHGKEVSGLVREVLVPQRVVVLELPWLLAQMRHLGLAGPITPGAFCTLLTTSLGSSAVAPLVPEPPLSFPTLVSGASAAKSQQNSGALDYFYPKLELNVTEPVFVTQLSDPYRVYCQLRSLSKEIQILSEGMCQAFEAFKGKDVQEASLTPGSPCAARGIDGCWYRALLLEVYPGGSPEKQPGAVAQVICVDYGRKEFVTKRNLRRLPAEYFRMPVVTYPCSLHGITDGGAGWSHSQISQLKTLLLGKVVQARIEAYCPFEHLYYVTLFGEDGLNLNCLYGVQAHCLAQSLLHSTQECTSELMTELKSIRGRGREEEPGSLMSPLSTLAAVPLPVVHLKAGEYHSVQVTFLQDPTEFWVHLQEHRQPLCRLKQNLNDFYSQTKKLESILLEPKPGSLCCVMLKESSYHRALVTKVQGKGIEVFLVDKGNTEMVDLYKVKELLPQFKELPAVALRCTLANPSPSQAWSLDAVDYFRKAVLNKELVIKVLGTQGAIYVVELFDNALKGEKNLSKIMSQKIYEHHENVQVKKVPKMIDRPLMRGPQGESIQHQSSERTWSLYHRGVAEEDCNVFTNSSSCILQNYSEIRPGLSCEEEVDVGSTVDVIVSYTESPGLFWCQLAKSSQSLKALMAKIQDYCLHSVQPHDWPNPVCLSKYSEDNKWYRALIISKVNCRDEVEVAYVDYGNKEHVSLKNIRATKAEFLKLKAQAFRCSLYNLIQPNGQNPFVWDEKATEAFQEFVDSGSKIELKCTIFALAALNRTDLFNIVDLITPFDSACHFLTRKGLARSVQPQKPLIPSVHLLSYYYSTHDIKIGSEEIVYITHVKAPCFFYCQLARSADVLGQLTKNIGKLSKAWHSLQTSQAPGNLYLAKFTDDCWYRAVVTSAKANKEVFFVDFGNTQLLENEDLIVVPNDAFELLLLPMQAIRCCLSDVAADISKDATEWFEKAVQDKPLKAVIVAKEPDGKLVVELYDGKVKINAKLKEVLGLQGRQRISRYAENEASLSKCSSSREVETEKRPFLMGFVKPVSENRRWCTENKEVLGSIKHSSWKKEGRQVQQKTEKGMARRFPELVERMDKNAPVTGRTDSNCMPLLNREKKPSDGNRNQANVHSSFKNMCDLPQKSIKPGLKTPVYISHINNPSDFYVQLVEDEPVLDSISEKLNNNSDRIESLNGKELHTGDLICAIFSEDSLWYRAMVSAEPSGELVSVQYIDYGNTAVIGICKTGGLLEECSSFPVMSIHCSLCGVESTAQVEWTQEAVLYFSERTSDIQMNSEFLEKSEDKWEILLCDEKGNVTVDLINGYLAYQKPLLVETVDEEEHKADLINLGEVVSDKHSKSSSVSDARCFCWKIPEIGQTLRIYSVVAKSPEYFWCQFTERENIDSIEKWIKEAGELKGIIADDIKRGCPCLAKCSEDDKFYRAIVSNVEEDTLTVIHIDYGSEECINAEMIRQISADLLAIPAQAFLCCLFGFSAKEGSWTEGVNRIFCDMVADFPLEVVVVDKKAHNPLEIPVFIVKLECQKINISEQIKSLWRYNTEDSGSTLAYIHNPEEQAKDAEESSNTVVFETETFCSLMSPPTASVLENVLDCSNLSQPVSPSSVDEGSRISLEMFPLTSPTYQTRHHWPPAEPLITGDQQATFETVDNERDYCTSEKGSDISNSTDTFKMQLPASNESQVLEQDPFESQVETESKAKIFTQSPCEIQLPSEGLLDFRPPFSDDSLQMPELVMLGMPSFQGTPEKGASEDPSLHEESQQRSKLGFSRDAHMEEELEQSPALRGSMNSLLHPLQANKKMEDISLLDPPAILLETDLKLQDLSCSKSLVEANEVLQDNVKTCCVELQTLLEKSCRETQMNLDMCEKFKENNFVGQDCLSNTLLNEQQIETSFYHSRKKETTSNLKGFDIGSKCMVWSGIQWYKAKILGISPEGTKVLDLSSGNEVVVNPVDVWNGIPELDSNLTEKFEDKTDTLHTFSKGES